VGAVLGAIRAARRRSQALSDSTFDPLRMCRNALFQPEGDMAHIG